MVLFDRNLSVDIRLSFITKTFAMPLTSTENLEKFFDDIQVGNIPFARNNHRLILVCFGIFQCKQTLILSMELFLFVLDN